MATDYHLPNIRTLLNEGFSTDELRDFCFDTPEFKPVHHELAELTGKAAIVRYLLDFAQRRELIDLLLIWAKANNPAKFAKYQPYQVQDHLPRRTPSVIPNASEESPTTPATLGSLGAITTSPPPEKTSESRGTPNEVRSDMGDSPSSLPDRLTITHPIHLELVRIPAGEFLMGSDPATDKDAQPREQPQHCVYVSEFYIGQYPVTNEQYAAFVKAKHNPPSHWKSGKIPSGIQKHPVVNVSWNDAVAFCEWLSRASGRTVHLPTEAEWEKAARGSDGRIYAWGNEWDQTRLNSGKLWKGLASIITSAVISTTPVGHYSPQGDTLYGAADMCGNVWEWCADWYNEKEYQRQVRTAIKDPQGPTQGQSRVLRGGSFFNYEDLVRCAYRYGDVPRLMSLRLGFRLVVSPIL